MEINEDLAFEKRIWFIERIVWSVMGMVMLLSLLGLFGGGGIFKKAMESPERKIALEFFSFGRVDKDLPLLIGIESGEGEKKLSIESAYIGKFKIVSVTPEPEKTVSADGWMTYFFPCSKGRLDVAFHMQPLVAGRVKGLVEAEGERLEISQFVYF